MVSGLLLGVLCGLSTNRAIAQSRPDAATLKVNSRLVVLDVSVTDSKGNPVLDLKKDEIRVYESDRLQKVRSFDTPETHAMPAGSTETVLVRGTADLPKIGEAPVTIIVLDELNLNFADESYAHQKLEAWLKTQPAVLQNPAALMAVTYKDFEVLQDYTQDRDVLLKTLKSHVPTIPWRKDSSGSVGGVASEAMFETLGALEQIAQSTRGVPGRKNLIWVGDGFPSVNATDVPQETSEKVMDYLRRITNSLLKARVTLSIIGPTLKPSQPVVVETQSQTDAVEGGAISLLNTADLDFTSLAPPSGGRAYSNRNDLDKEIEESVEAGVNFYTLSYVPTDDSNDPKHYRHIRVEILRPGLTARTRDGYFSESDKPQLPTKQQLAFDLYGAAKSTLQYTDLHVKAKRSDRTDYVLNIDASQMTWREKPDGTRHADTIVLAVYLSANGKMLNRDINIVGSETASALGMSGATATIETRVMPPPGTTRIRFVLRDAISGRIGTVDVNP
jgi:VWFA-related protein